MTTDAAPTLSAAAFLFDDEDSVGQLAAALKESGILSGATAGLSKLSKAGLDAVGGQIASIAHGMLDMGLDTLVVEGWRKFSDLQAAAQRTKAASGSSEVLDLASHSITSAHQPKVELRLDDVPIATVGFALSLTFVIKAAVATVRDGRLVSLHSGICDVDAELQAGDKPLATRSGHFQLPVMVPLGGGGIALLGHDGLVASAVSEVLDADVSEVMDGTDGTGVVAATVVGTTDPPAPEVTEDVAPALGDPGRSMPA